LQAIGYHVSRKSSAISFEGRGKAVRKELAVEAANTIRSFIGSKSSD